MRPTGNNAISNLISTSRGIISTKFGAYNMKPHLITSCCVIGLIKLLIHKIR